MLLIPERVTLEDLIQSLKDKSEKLGDVNSAVKLLKQARDLKAEFEELTQPLDKLVDDLNKDKVPTIFKEHGTTSTTVDGYRYTVSNTTRASIQGGKKDEALQWLRDNELGELITETVNASTLSAQARILAEEKGLELDPDLFNVYVQPNMSVTKASK